MKTICVPRAFILKIGPARREHVGAREMKHPTHRTCPQASLKTPRCYLGPRRRYCPAEGLPEAAEWV